MPGNTQGKYEGNPVTDTSYKLCIFEFYLEYFKW